MPNNLIRSIKYKVWSSVLLYLEEAKILDENDLHPLHEVCCDRGAPLNIVKYIYYACPKAALMKDTFEQTPISIAVGAGFEHVVYFLANACPEACAMIVMDGSTPMHSTISRLASSDMIYIMLNANPKLAFAVDDCGISAFHYFFHQWNVLLRVCMHNTIISDRILDKYIGHGNWKIHDVYKNMRFFLKAAHLHRTAKILDDNHLLHCALREERCHWAFCKLLINLRPEQVLSRDLDGNSPLRIIEAF